MDMSIFFADANSREDLLLNTSPWHSSSSPRAARSPRRPKYILLCRLTKNANSNGLSSCSQWIKQSQGRLCWWLSLYPNWSFRSFPCVLLRQPDVLFLGCPPFWTSAAAVPPPSAVFPSFLVLSLSGAETSSSLVFPPSPVASQQRDSCLVSVRTLRPDASQTVCLIVDATHGS